MEDRASNNGLATIDTLDDWARYIETDHFQQYPKRKADREKWVGTIELGDDPIGALTVLVVDACAQLRTLHTD